MTIAQIREMLIELTVEELGELIARAEEIRKRKESEDPVLKALEAAGYDFENICCEE